MVENLLQCKPSADILNLKRIEQFLHDNVVSAELKEFFFGRSNHDGGDSLVEKILSTPNASKLMKLIWTKFELFLVAEILSIVNIRAHLAKLALILIFQKNYKGKMLLNYVVESKDDENLLTFLTFGHFNNPTNVNKKFFLVMKNEQFMMISKRTIFEHYLSVCVKDVKTTEIHNEESDKLNQDLKYDFFQIVFSFLEEIGKIDDIVKEIPISNLLDLAADDKFYLKLLELDNDFCDSVVVQELKSRKQFIDDLLGNIVAYWTTADENYEKYRNKLTELSPFFDMMISIIEGNEDSFLRNFFDNLERLEKSYSERYGESDVTCHYTSSFLFIMLLAAIKNNQKKIIDRILEYENFVTVNFKFPPNMATTEMSYYVTSKLLEHGYEIGKEEIPRSWLTAEVLKEFLDSRIKFNGEELVEIDCNFLLHPHTRKYQIKTHEDVNNKLIFWEDISALEYIMKSNSLGHLISHPVLSTYIELKTLKHKNFYWWTFFLFTLLYFFPFGLLVCFLFTSDRHEPKSYLLFNGTRVVCIFSIMVMFTREYFKYRFIDKTLKIFFRKPPNFVNTVLILVSVLLIVFSFLLS